MRILIVDDHAETRQGVRSLLSERPEWIVCGEAMDGLDAIEKAESLRPDVVLMDVSMPRMNGLKATKAIRQIVPQAKVILLSQNDPDVVSRQAFEANAHKHVVKADLSEKLLPTIEEVIGGKNGAEQIEREEIRSGGGREAPAASTGDGTDLGADEVSARLLKELPALRQEADKTAGLLAAIVDSSDDAIISKTLEGVITSWNKSAERVFGYAAAEAIGKSITLIIPENRRDEEKQILDRIRRGERVEHFETVRQRKNGRQIDISLTISPVRDSSGRIIGASKVARDITERKSAEAERLKFVALADRCTEFVGMCDMEYRPFYINSAGMHLVGAEPNDDLSSARVTDFFFPEDRPFVANEFLPKVLREGAGEVEIRFRHLKTGAPVWMIYNVFAIKDADGIPIALATFSQNITQRVETERALAEQARLLDLSSDAIMVRDAEDRITYWNKGASETYGYTREEAVGQVSHELLQTEFPAPIETLAAQVRRDGRWSGELVHVCKDGTRIVAASRWVVDLDTEGRLLSVLETNNDVTQEKETEKALRESEERFRALADSLEAKVRSRTRELEERNAEVFRQSMQLRELSRLLLQSQDDERRRIARELHDSAGQMLTILGINLARLAIDARKNAPQLSKLASESQTLAQQLSQEIRTTSYLLHPPLLDEEGLNPAIDWYLQGLKERSGLDISLKIREDFGRLPREMELVVFRLVQECITNVHRHSGSKSAVVELSRGKDKVIVEVQDHGRGISPERLAEIQSRNAGVGIRGMRERVRQFEGELNIETSELGTKVCVTLPAPSSAAATSGNGVEKARAAG